MPLFRCSATSTSLGHTRMGTLALLHRLMGALRHERKIWKNVRNKRCIAICYLLVTYLPGVCLTAQEVNQNPGDPRPRSKGGKAKLRENSQARCFQGSQR